MDDARIRTFLEIAERGSFQAAAEVLNVTQTTVSARIRTLEEELGRRLFQRNRSGATLTPAGEAFVGYAQTILQVWGRARHHVAVPGGRNRIFAAGAEPSLWHPLLVDWMVVMRERMPQAALRAQVGVSEQLVAMVRAGVLDVALLYAPRLHAGLRVEMLYEETLVLVRSTTAPDGDYIHVDWGIPFADRESAIHVGLGPLGLNYLLRVGGSGYFRKGAVGSYLDQGLLEIVDDAPTFPYPVFAVCAAAADPQAVEPALDAIRECISPGSHP